MKFILALYPNSRGLGYACLDMKGKIIEAEIVNIYPICNNRILRRIEKFLSFYNPTLILLKDIHSQSPTKKRTLNLLSTIESNARDKNITVCKYSQQQINEAFEVFNAKNRYERAHLLVDFYPELSERAPKLKKIWEREDYNMGIFDALSLAITHAYLS